MTTELTAFLTARLDDDERAARCDPARALREVAAKRAILAAWMAAEASRNRWNHPDYRSGITDGRSDALANVLRALAAVYCDHPDYLPDWRPA